VVLDIVTAGTGGYCLSADHANLGAANSVDFIFNSAVGRPQALSATVTGCPASTATVPTY
jgi:hypothetical protein